MIAVVLSIHCEKAEQVPMAMESLGRVAAGMALDGLAVAVNIVQIEDDEDDQ